MKFLLSRSTRAYLKLKTKRTRGSSVTVHAFKCEVLSSTPVPPIKNKTKQNPEDSEI
jgi:hypothetical protein